MKLTNRLQNDGKQDELSEAGGIACTAEEDRARQEDAPNTDLNRIIRTFGADAYTTKRQVFGEADYDLTAQDAFQTVRDVRGAHRSLSPEIQERYPTWTSLLAAAERGDLDLRTNQQIAAEAATAATAREEAEQLAFEQRQKKASSRKDAKD